MGTLPARPRLRWPLEINRHLIRDENNQEQEILLLSCPLGVAQPLPLSAAIAPLLAEFSGNLSVEDICQKYASAGVSKLLVEELIGILENSLYLDSPKFAAAERSYREEYAKLVTRPAALAGLAYPAEGKTLASLIKQYVESPSLGEVELSLADKDRKKTELIGIKSPHIDYRRGGGTYGAIFPDLYSDPGEVILLIGTSHQYSRGLFHLSRKSFSSPLGTSQADLTFVETLAAEYGQVRSFSEELVHAKEHSLELQIPFLQHGKPKATIVPILVGSFYSYLKAEKMPEEYEEYDAFVAALASISRTRLRDGQKVRFLAGVDMAHVGSQFGDSFALTDDYLNDVKQRDIEYLRLIQQQDKKRLFEHVAEDGDARRICGFPTMYTLIDLCDRIGISYTTELRSYQQAVDKQRGCAVTFAGMSFYFDPFELSAENS